MASTSKDIIRSVAVIVKVSKVVNRFYQIIGRGHRVRRGEARVWEHWLSMVTILPWVTAEPGVHMGRTVGAGGG